MKLFYYKSDPPNFGDMINSWLWPKLVPTAIDNNESDLFLAIGTILDSRVPDWPRKTVFGTGVRSPDSVPHIDGRWDIRFVRGPLSGRALGGARHLTDAALCIRLLEFPAVTKRYTASFIPWFRNVAAPWEFICRVAGVHLIDVRKPVEQVIEEIRASDVVLTEALHGAIVADLFRVPWIHVRYSSHMREGNGVSEYKWNDWCLSMELEDRPVTLTHCPLVQRKKLRGFNEWMMSPKLAAQLRRTVRAEERTLSADAVLERLELDLRDEVQRIVECGEKAK